MQPTYEIVKKVYKDLNGHSRLSYVFTAKFNNGREWGIDTREHSSFLKLMGSGKWPLEDQHKLIKEYPELVQCFGMHQFLDKSVLEENKDAILAYIFETDGSYDLSIKYNLDTYLNRMEILQTSFSKHGFDWIDTIVTELLLRYS